MKFGTGYFLVAIVLCFVLPPVGIVMCLVGIVLDK